jgi:hypothetical protein
MAKVGLAKAAQELLDHGFIAVLRPDGRVKDLHELVIVVETSKVSDDSDVSDGANPIDVF